MKSRHEEAFRSFRVTRRGRTWIAEGATDAAFGTPVVVPGQERQGGVYAWWRWGGEALDAEVDPLGFYPLFYCHRDDMLILSNSTIQAIADGASSEPDREALSVFFRLGWFVGEHTPFKKIKVLPPGGRLHWHDGELTVTDRRWSAGHFDGPREQAVSHAIDLTEDAIVNCGKQAKSPITVPLSGGRDSRHILFALHKNGIPVRDCVTLNYSRDGEDAECAAARGVAGRLNVAHRVVPIHRRLSREHITTRLLTHLCADECQNVIALRYHARQFQSVLFDGIGGDILSRNRSGSRAGFEGLARAHRWDEAVDDLYEGIERLTGQRQWVEALAGESLPDIDEGKHLVFEALRDKAAYPCPGSAFLFWERTRREIALIPASLWATAPQVMCPFLDPRLVAFWLSVPPEYTDLQPIHDEMIRRAYPAHHDLPFAEDFADRDSSRRRRLVRGGLRAITRSIDGISACSINSTAEMIRELRIQYHFRRHRVPYTAWCWRYWFLLAGTVETTNDLGSMIHRILEWDARANS